MKDACVAVDVDDGEFTLLNVAEVYYVVVMPAEFLARREVRRICVVITCAIVALVRFHF